MRLVCLWPFDDVTRCREPVSPRLDDHTLLFWRSRSRRAALLKKGTTVTSVIVGCFEVESQIMWRWCIVFTEAVQSFSSFKWSAVSALCLRAVLGRCWQASVTYRNVSTATSAWPEAHTDTAEMLRLEIRTMNNSHKRTRTHTHTDTNGPKNISHMFPVNPGFSCSVWFPKHTLLLHVFCSLFDPTNECKLLNHKYLGHNF